MKDIQIKVSKETRKVNLSKSVMGNDAENLQGNLVFTFPSDYDPDKTGVENEFVDGIARLEYTIDGESYYVPNLTKQNESYVVPIKSVLTKQGQVYMQLVITEGTNLNEIPIFKSNRFYVIVNKSINAEIEQPDEFPTWEELFNVYIAQVENLDLDATKSGETTEIVITKKNGTQKTVNIDDGTGLNYNWVGTSLGVKREDEQEYVYTNLKGDKGDAGSVKFIIVETLPTQDIQEDAMYLVPITPDEQHNNYAEYIYVNGNWELLGKISVTVDLTNYVKNTDYATDVKGGVVKTNTYYGLYTAGNGLLYSMVRPYDTYNEFSDNGVISKGTLENVITGKGLVSNTDYATSNVGGVVKNTSSNNFSVNSSGAVYAETRTYEQYQSGSTLAFISKGTLENVITGKDLTTKAYVDGLVGNISNAIDLINGESV